MSYTSPNKMILKLSRQSSSDKTRDMLEEEPDTKKKKTPAKRKARKVAAQHVMAIVMARKLDHCLFEDKLRASCKHGMSQRWKTDHFLVPFRPGALFSVASYPPPGLSS